MAINGKVVWRVKVLYSERNEVLRGPRGGRGQGGGHGRSAHPLRQWAGQGPEERRIRGNHERERTLQRAASAADLLRVEENDTREERAFEICREKVEARGLSHEARERSLHP